MATARARWSLAVAAGGIVLLFVGRWGAGIAVERWWVEGIAPEGARFLTGWMLLRSGLEIAGIGVACAWCVGHFFWVVRSIDTIQVPRRLGDLEIRELMSGAAFRGGAVVAGLLLGILLGAGGSRAAPLVALAWQGVPTGVDDPVLGLDLGLYLAQLPVWEATLAFAGRLTAAALIGAAVAHFAVGGLRVGRGGLAMTGVARRQLGHLAASGLALMALGEALGPLRGVAGLDTGPWSGLDPSIRWGVAAAWSGSAALLSWWVVRPQGQRLLAATLFWGVPLLLATLAAAGGAPSRVDPGITLRTAGANGSDRVIETTLAADGKVARVGPGIWERPVLPALLSEKSGARVLAAAQQRVTIGRGSVPAWVALRDDGAGRALIVVADDRLAPGGGPVSFREGDPVAYPGIVTWRPVPALVVAPEAPDSVVPSAAKGIPLGGAVRRLSVAWGTESGAPLGPRGTDAALWWRRAPRDRVQHIFPPAWWDEPRPYLHDGRLWWIVDGWFVQTGAALAPPIPWGEGQVRYARPGLLALVDAESGEARLFRRPVADPVADAWVRLAGALIRPADSIPPGLIEGSPSPRAVRIVARTLQPGDGLPGVTQVWGPRGPVPQVALAGAEHDDGRLGGLLFYAAEAGYLVVRWSPGNSPLDPRVLSGRWGRFASLERLQDSVRRAGGRLETGEVRYDLDTSSTLAVRIRWAISAAGVPTVAWVELAQGDRLGAARTPGAALANLLGESAPLVPEPETPDRIVEARRWAARADSALRAGDLEGFGRAFEALRRVLGTP